MGLFDDLPDVDGPKGGTGQVSKTGLLLQSTRQGEPPNASPANSTGTPNVTTAELNKDAADKKPASVTSWSATAIMFKPQPTRKPPQPPKPKASAIAAASTTIKTTIVSLTENEPLIEAQTPSFHGSLSSSSVGATKNWNMPPTSLKRKHTSGKGGKKAALAPPSFTEDYDPMRPNEYQYSKDELRRLKLEKHTENLRKRDGGHDNRKKRRHSHDSDEDEDENQSRGEDNEEHGHAQHRHHRRHKPRHNTMDDGEADTSRYHRVSSNSPAHKRHNSQSPEVKPVVSKSNTINLNESGDDAYLRRLQMSQHSSAPPAKVNLGVDSGEEAYLRRIKIAQQDDNTIPSPPKATSNVVLLKNMVGPGEVDDTLQDETASECRKYGEVNGCLIYEVPNGLVPNDQAVRIFVNFKTLDGAQKALQDLNGRFFAGRQVVAESYDDVAFAKFDLSRGLVLNKR